MHFAGYNPYNAGFWTDLNENNVGNSKKTNNGPKNVNYKRYFEFFDPLKFT